jgi:hypothetical protein
VFNSSCSDRHRIQSGGPLGSFARGFLFAAHALARLGKISFPLRVFQRSVSAGSEPRSGLRSCFHLTARKHASFCCSTLGSSSCSDFPGTAADCLSPSFFAASSLLVARWSDSSESCSRPQRFSQVLLN